MPSFFFRELKLITVLLLICDSYMSWSTRFVSLKLCRDFPFSIPFRFYQNLYYCSTKCMDSLNLKRHNSFQNKIMEKPPTVLLPDLWFLSCKKSFKIQWYLLELEFPKNWVGEKIFKLRKSKFWERQFFSVVTFK